MKSGRSLLLCSALGLGAYILSTTLAYAAPVCSIGKVNRWNSGFVVSAITVRNNSGRTLTPPQVELSFNKPVRVNKVWGARATSFKRTVRLTGTRYNSVLKPGGLVSFGFQGAGSPAGISCKVVGVKPVKPIAKAPTPPRPTRPITPPPKPAAPAPGRSGEAANVALINRNGTRNVLFDANPYRNVPMRDISVGDLTLNRDIYNEPLLDTSQSGYFRVKCEVSHFAYDDPIVFPNQPGRAHLHMFFGNTQTNAFSTFNSLLNSGTGTCNGEDLNRSAYWVPAMLDRQGNALIPDQIMVYYKNDNFRVNGANERVSPFPNNLRMIAGNGAATSPQRGYTGSYKVQPTVSFSCGPAYNSNHRRQATIPDCSGSRNQLEMQIAFPQCFNRAAGTYRPDQSHMSYSEGGYYGSRCPDSHSTDVSSIMYRIFFRPDSYGGSLTNLHLSSDVKMDKILPGGTTLHADWFGAWHPEAMDMWVENCNNTRADCETGLLDRTPPVSMVLRKRGFYAKSYRAPARELIKLCPGKTFNQADPLRSVAMCKMR